MYETYQEHPKQAKGSIRVVLVVAFLACAIGAGLAIKNGSKIVKPAIIIVLILLAAKVIQGLITG